MSSIPPLGRPSDVPVQDDIYPKPVPAVKQSRDKAQYVRQQTGHSFIIQWFVLGILTVFIVPIYYSVSPNHYWHL